MMSSLRMAFAGLCVVAMNAALAQQYPVKPIRFVTTGGPDVLPRAEAGLPGYEAMSWYGVLVPAGTPALVIDKLHG